MFNKNLVAPCFIALLTISTTVPAADKFSPDSPKKEEQQIDITAEASVTTSTQNAIDNQKDQQSVGEHDGLLPPIMIVAP